MITLNDKAFFWEEFDENKNPINPKECQIVFNPSDGGTISYLDVNEYISFNKIKDKKIKILYGYTASGKAYTLFNLKLNGMSSNTSLDFQIYELTYSVEYIFYGSWIDTNERLPHISVRYSHLEEWFDLIETHDIKGSRDNIFIEEIIVVHNAKNDKSIKKGEVGFWITNSWHGEFYTKTGEIKYQLKNYIFMGKHQGFTFSESINLTQKIKSFFEIISFYSHKNIFIEEFIIQQEKKDFPDDIPDTIQVLFKQEDYQEEGKHHIDYLFRYKDIEDNFIEILNQWIENYDKNINEFTAFLNVITDKSYKINIYSHLFQLMSALEAYHRRNDTFDETKQLEYNDYLNNLSENLQTCLPQNDTERIIQSLQYANQPNFRTRLKDMIEISDVKSILPLNHKIYKSLNNYIYNLRNIIAHSKDIVLIDKKVESSLEFLKLVVLLVMIKDISLNKLDISNYRSKMNLDIVDRKLRESFGGKK